MTLNQDNVTHTASINGHAESMNGHAFNPNVPTQHVTTFRASSPNGETLRVDGNTALPTGLGIFLSPPDGNQVSTSNIFSAAATVNNTVSTIFATQSQAPPPPVANTMQQNAIAGVITT
jgi:hypothetical protein